MAAEEPPSDPFRVRLNWPDQGGERTEGEKPGRRPEKPHGDDEADDTAKAAHDDGPATEVVFVDEPNEGERGSVIFTVASRLEGLRAALNTVSHRLDSMIKREEQFREFTTARLAEQAQQMALAAAAGSQQLAEGMRNQDRAMADLRNAVVDDVADLRKSLEISVRELRSGLVPDLADLKVGIESALSELRGSVHSDVTELRSGLGSALTDLRTATKSDLGKLATDVGENLSEVEAGVTTKLTAFRSDIEADVASLTRAVEAVGDRLDVIAKVVSAIGPAVEHAMEVTRQAGEDLSDLLQRQAVEIDVLRAEVVSAGAHAEERDAELSAEVGRLSEELKAIRRRMTVRARPAGGRAAPAATTPVDQDDEEFEPPRPRRAPRRARPE